MTQIRSALFFLLAAFPAVANADCSFCHQDDEVEDLATATPNMGTIDRSCLDLKAEYVARKEQLDKNEFQCSEFQLYGYQAGCCYLVDPDGCTVCPDGTNGLDGYSVYTEGSGDPAPEVCEGYRFQPYALNGIFEAGSCEDTRLRRGAYYCGCPNTWQEVFLCPDKQPPNRRRRGDFTRSENCGQTEYLFSLFKQEEMNALGTDYNKIFGFNYQAWCECNDVYLENDFNCEFCPEGTSIKEGFHEKICNEDTAAVDINGRYDYRRTCTQVADYARYVTTEPKCSDAAIEAARLFCCGASSLGLFFTMAVTGLLLLVQIFS